ncbi:MAG: hypothetical protein JSW06_07185 [Thermoplasmatales archaeon]|nr:MAG: hypothetical protein JSW06_07185 [Thermoplasmatales archaeon]
MQKILLKNGIVFAVILVFVGTNVILSAGNVVLQTNFDNSILGKGDELDQYQMEMDSFGPIGRSPESSHHYYIVAQGFTPTKNILTRVEIMIRKGATTSYDLILNIRDNLSGINLTSITKNHVSIPSEDFNWIEFDFDDILVKPGTIYYIVCSTFDTIGNWYDWGAKMGNVYPNGTIAWSEDGGQQWYIDSTLDATFKSYGWDNLPPEVPIIDGPTRGKAGVEYTYCVINAIDPDGDDIWANFSWGDGSYSGWIGPNASGGDICASHAWEYGNYEIKVKLKDEWGLESDWSDPLPISMPRNKPFNFNILLLNWLFESFPNAFPILRYILGL